MRTKREPHPFRGLVAGVAGGLVASYAMTQFQTVWSRAQETVRKARSTDSEESGTGSGDETRQTEGHENESSGEKEPATVRVAEKASETVLHHRLCSTEKQWAGPAVHYATGAGVGAIYGVVGEMAPLVTRGAGLPFGIAVWFGLDEGVLPLTGLGPPPHKAPVSTHSYALASHCVYGAVAEIVRRAVRKALD